MMAGYISPNFVYVLAKKIYVYLNSITILGYFSLFLYGKKLDKSGILCYGAIKIGGYGDRENDYEAY